MGERRVIVGERRPWEREESSWEREESSSGREESVLRFLTFRRPHWERKRREGKGEKNGIGRLGE